MKKTAPDRRPQLERHVEPFNDPRHQDDPFYVRERDDREHVVAVVDVFPCTREPHGSLVLRVKIEHPILGPVTADFSVGFSSVRDLAQWILRRLQKCPEAAPGSQRGNLN